jgi:hypothetical protein
MKHTLFADISPIPVKFAKTPPHDPVTGIPTADQEILSALVVYPILFHAIAS